MEGPLRPPSDPGFRLIETCRWTPEGGVHLRARHLVRLAASAARLGISPDGAEAALDAVTGPGPMRVRLTVARAGQVEVTAQSFAHLPDGTVWQLAMAEARLQSGDPWRQVKTTERAIYDDARAAMPEGADELVFLNERGEVCEGTITNIFADLGQGLVTPPLTCGVLPGVLRSEMLATGQARESVLRADDLARARAVFVGNALRGLIPARWRAHPA